MLVEDLFNRTSLSTQDLLTIRQDCSQFLSESRGIALYKALPTNYNNLHKVKVRLKRTENLITSTFNQAFVTESRQLSQRAIFAYPTPPVITEDLDLFYVFPINNYKFLYSKEVTDSTSEYKHVLDTMLESFDNMNKATEIVTDLLKFTYSTHSLYEGLESNAEIIIHGIPFYYAVRVKSNPIYNQLIA